MKILEKLFFLIVVLFMATHNILAMENQIDDEDRRRSHLPQPSISRFSQLHIHPSIHSNEFNISFLDEGYFVDGQPVDIPTLRKRLLERNPDKVTLSWVGQKDLEICSPEMSPPHIAA